ncbi:M23 family metallopeptidase [Alkalibacillus salilacus]|uniref:Murein DD-endopeptidase MepM/ murein hydrolase activator NlpD n=1 Tax=Alkalibacillus salilacus TaxID=284582 RepID=A0ABT9VEW0_9BACI|nr:M23 family metallopeptidase [Alkalibacillus salilacus]MDQ0159516.1 murein DD-endopeptidase MepM/ murein hydrolase activator NlpD [Alkalibacillus salilacus]
MKRRIITGLFIFIVILTPSNSWAEDESLSEERMNLYQKTASLTQVPWSIIAAIDQYERNINDVDEDRITGIQMDPNKWFGLLAVDENPSHYEATIQAFNGIGKDGDGDQYANPQNDEDVLFTFAHWLNEQLGKGISYEESLAQYYDREKAAQMIKQYQQLFSHYSTVELDEHAFPIPSYNQYSYRSTWGAGRGYGGRRIHEGTDLFASYGTPVRSTSYGIVEIKGWNKYGGWRIGIRDTDNVYHYYAHLNGFEDELEEGDIVEPGDVIGYVGASGYGPVGTSGKFPPHLHYGMYRDNGENEWAFDPYPHLKRWEKQSQ